MTNVKKQYGLWTGIAMVIGIVIGSGVFIKAGGVLEKAGGDLKIALLAWFVGGIIMVCSGFCFAIYSTRIIKYNGVVDYVEAATNKKIGYILAWIITTLYYPIVASIVALLSGQYFFQLIGSSVGLTDWQNFLFAFIIMALMVLLNYLSPMLSSKFQISATIIKLIPIGIIAVLGLFATLIVGDNVGIINALTVNGLNETGEVLVPNFGDAVKATAFAYEGWVCATAINAELKDSKKNLPKALVFGTIAILVFYIIYYISLSALLGNTSTIVEGANAPIVAFQIVMPKIGYIFFTFFIMVSCLGTVNGVSIGCCRGMYTMACRGQGIMPDKVAKLSKNESVSFLSCLYGFGCMTMMLFVWYLAMHEIWLFKYLGTMDEIVCAIIYGVYITMYIYIIRKFKDCNVFQRYIMPIFAIIGSLFFVICGTGLYQYITTKDLTSIKAFLVFMGLFVVLTIPSLFFYKSKK